MSKTTATDAAFEPSPLRRQHARITRMTGQIVDANGSIGRPYEVESLLARLERHGDISKRERLAGEEFSRLFRLASLDPLRAADMERIGGGAQGFDGVEWARRQITEALAALGGSRSPCGCCAWYILGCDLTMREWSMREGWGGRPVNQHVVKGTLLGALGVLAHHFGL